MNRFFGRCAVLHSLYPDTDPPWFCGVKEILTLHRLNVADAVRASLKVS